MLQSDAEVHVSMLGLWVDLSW